MGMRGLINDMRRKRMHVGKCLAGASMVHDAEIPHIYCMSPSLAIKPKVPSSVSLFPPYLSVFLSSLFI
jgi:hypothetical protein